MKIKKIISLCLVCLLLVCLGVSVASAENNIVVNVGESLASSGYNTVYSTSAGSIVAINYTGSLPSGVTVANDNYASVSLVGTPTTAGTYKVTLEVTVQNGNSYNTYAVPVNIYVGTGYTGSSSNSDVIISNSGSSSSSNVYIPNAYVSTPPVLTKSPTNETVSMGESAVFVARADNASSITWYLISPDMSQKYYASAVGSYFVGTTASGTNSERLVLSNISKDLNGWMVEAEFTNSDGTTSSNPAFLTVEVSIVESPSPSPSASPAPTPTPTPSASPAPTPTPTPSTTTYVNGTAVQNGSSTGTGFGGTMGSTSGNSDTTKIGSDGSYDIPSASGYNQDVTTTAAGAGSGSAGTSRSSSHIGAYILAVIAGAVIIGSVLVMALYMKGKISLGKLEQLLGGNQSDDMFDNSGDYYNPDDFKDNNKKDT